MSDAQNYNTYYNPYLSPYRQRKLMKKARKRTFFGWAVGVAVAAAEVQLVFLGNKKGFSELEAAAAVVVVVVAVEEVQLVCLENEKDFSELEAVVVGVAAEEDYSENKKDFSELEAVVEEAVAEDFLEKTKRKTTKNIIDEEDVGEPQHFNELNTKDELLKSFAYYFRHGAAAECNKYYRIVKYVHKDQ
ncbi:unnamed protein product [Trichogramma brassicae]|uniref:Uncharacterized protein n=1 Tax=Trichogramma brassicae TaxID=86971 RepID=A0A6H5I728_9HYME|nr:unnamed protein product [Trichogramma brassicae]